MVIVFWHCILLAPFSGGLKNLLCEFLFRCHDFTCPFFWGIEKRVRPFNSGGLFILLAPFSGGLKNNGLDFVYNGNQILLAPFSGGLKNKDVDLFFRHFHFTCL